MEGKTFKTIQRESSFSCLDTSTDFTLKLLAGMSVLENTDKSVVWRMIILYFDRACFSFD